ncbi:MAG: HAD-IA family hydrolase [Rhodospirillales bacterium]
MNRLALFDCDGTLVDSQFSIVASMQLAFERNGLAPPSPESVRKIVGLHLGEAIGRLIGEPDAPAIRYLVESYREAFSDMHRDPALQEALFEGIPSALDRFESAGWLLGIATGKGRRGLDRVLGRSGLDGRFVTLKTADDGPGKPDPAIVRAALAEAGADAGSCVVIGDTSYDMVMAERAGTASIGVSWGYHPVAELTRSGARHIAYSADELPDLAERALGG